MSSVRQSIEHLFSFHYNLFKLFQQPDHFRLLVSSIESYKLLFNSFFLWNCYQTIHQSSSYFLLAPPTLEQYLPLEEVLVQAPIVDDDQLGEVYNYYV